MLGKKIIKSARVAGATHYRIRYSHAPSRHYGLKRAPQPKVRSIHFFNKQDAEVGFMLADWQDINTYPTLRTWPDEMKNAAHIVRKRLG